MIVNLYEMGNKQEKIKQEKKENIIQRISIKKLQKYMIDNALSYLKVEAKEPIIKMLKEYIAFEYHVYEEKQIKPVIDKVLANMFGYGILQKYIDNKEITDIRVVDYNLIYIKQFGKWKKIEEKFSNVEELIEYIRYCIMKNNGNINFDDPMITVSDKKYNLRIEAGISPVNAFAPNIVIRIHRKEVRTLKELAKKEHMLDDLSYQYLKEAIQLEKNMIIAGKSGSGKTTLLKCLLNELPEEKPITINEETSEIFLLNKNVIQREIVERTDKNKSIKLDKLMKHSLVMSNDVIVIGELKGKETSLFFDAMSTGHMGLTTVHSSNAESTIDRLVTLFKRDENNQQYQESYIKKLLLASIDYIIYMRNYKVVQIIQYEYDEKLENYQMKKIYQYQNKKSECK